MQFSQKNQKGRARVAPRRIGVWQDPVWEDRFERLIKMTQRTSLIIELTGVDAKHAFVKAIMLRRLADCGIHPALPRGMLGSYQVKGFLRSAPARADAAYLVALHYGPRGPGEFTEVDLDLGQALDRLLEVYNRYRADLYPFGAEPRLTFEDYYLVIKGLQATAIGMHHCHDCGASHPFSMLYTVRSSCPYCAELKLDLKQAKDEIQRRRVSRQRVQFALKSGELGAVAYRA
jgi:hypothetical protein